MVQIIPASTTVAFLALCSYATSNPVSGLPKELSRPGNLLGYDPSVASQVSAFGTTIPKHKYVKLDRLSTSASASAVTSTDSYTPPGAVKARSDRKKRWLVGEDDRVLNEDDEFPLLAIGRLSWANGVYCSAALVGPRHVLTAKHCLPEDAGPGKFAPGYDKKDKHGSSEVEWMVSIPDEATEGACFYKADFSVLTLKDALGDEFGWLGSSVPHSEEFNKPDFSTLGYPSDLDGGNRPYKQSGITLYDTSLDCDETGPIYSDADAFPGQSGSPQYKWTEDGEPQIWSVLSHVIQSDDGNYSSWGSGQAMVDLINEARRDYP